MLMAQPDLSGSIKCWPNRNLRWWRLWLRITVNVREASKVCSRMSSAMFNFVWLGSTQSSGWWKKLIRYWFLFPHKCMSYLWFRKQPQSHQNKKQPEFCYHLSSISTSLVVPCKLDSFYSNMWICVKISDFSVSHSFIFLFNQLIRVYCQL